MWKTGALVLAVVLMGTGPVLAQDDYNARLTVYAAPSFAMGERTFIAADDLPVSTDYGAGWKLGLRLTGDLNSIFSGEATYNFGRNTFNVAETGPGIPARSFDITVHQLAVNGLFYFFEIAERWRPYVTAGLGLTRYSPTDDARTRALSTAFLTQPTRIDADNMIAFNFGGGVERQLGTGPFAVRVDLRDYVSDQPTFGLPETPFTPGGAFLPSADSLHNLEASIGLTFYF